MCVAQPEAVDAALSLFYAPTADGSMGSGGGSSQTFSRSPQKKTLMMHYALVLALHVESFTMAPEQVRRSCRNRSCLTQSLPAFECFANDFASRFIRGLDACS